MDYTRRRLPQWPTPGQIPNCQLQLRPHPICSTDETATADNISQVDKMGEWKAASEEREQESNALAFCSSPLISTFLSMTKANVVQFLITDQGVTPVDEIDFQKNS